MPGLVITTPVNILHTVGNIVTTITIRNIPEIATEVMVSIDRQDTPRSKLDLGHRLGSVYTSLLIKAMRANRDLEPGPFRVSTATKETTIVKTIAAIDRMDNRMNLIKEGVETVGAPITVAVIPAHVRHLVITAGIQQRDTLSTQLGSSLLDSTDLVIFFFF
ncbi:unnamed protein product [Heligmosomoides polygyrus]|uniref:WS_DGAT_C domain-containing protein n=1 Tax=Heligmosomoides polygyrus TaxID=6339 RepID=A0A183FMV3_HELPZ|nr:unnamed protein product [Heligmosomoides polygyrus]